MVNVWPSLQQVGDYLYYFTTPDGSVHKLTGSGWYFDSHDSTNIRYNLLPRESNTRTGTTTTSANTDRTRESTTWTEMGTVSLTSSRRLTPIDPSQ